MGYFYVGSDMYKRKNGYIKIGETGRDLWKREKEIKKQEPFKVLTSLWFINETKAQRLFVESYVRVKLEENNKLTQVKNDHFLYDVKKGGKKEQTNNFAKLALKYAIEASEMLKITYLVQTEEPYTYSIC